MAVGHGWRIKKALRRCLFDLWLKGLLSSGINVLSVGVKRLQGKKHVPLEASSFTSGSIMLTPTLSRQGILHSMLGPSVTAKQLFIDLSGIKLLYTNLLVCQFHCKGYRMTLYFAVVPFITATKIYGQ